MSQLDGFDTLYINSLYIVLATADKVSDQIIDEHHFIILYFYMYYPWSEKHIIKKRLQIIIHMFPGSSVYRLYLRREYTPIKALDVVFV